MKQLKDRIISAAILFSVILTGVCVGWWGYASQYQKILGTSPSSPMLQKPSSALVFAVLTAGLTAGIFVFLFRKKLPFFKLRTVSAMILILLLFVKIMKIWANDRDLTFALALLSPFSMKFMASRNWLWTDVSVAFCLTWTLCGILLFVLLVRKQVHWTWTAVRMTILANVFAIGTIHGGLRSLYPYVLEILIWLSIGEQGIQALQKWINQGKGGS